MGLHKCSECDGSGRIDDRETPRLVCGSLRAGEPHVPPLGCGMPLSWDRTNKREWREGVSDPSVAIRCLDCGALLCVACADRHFRDSPPRVGGRYDTGCYARAGQRCEGMLTHGCRHCGRIIGSLLR